jgi:hypothetical protein
MNRKSKKIVGTMAALAVILSIVMVSVPAEKEDERTERQFEEVYEIYKEQFGEIPAEQLEKISKQKFIEAYEKGFRGSASSKKNVGTRGSCSLGECRADLWWYKPPMSFKIHHWAESVGDAYQTSNITAGGSVYGATAFVYERSRTNMGMIVTTGDGWGHFDPNLWFYKAVNHAHARFEVGGASDWAHDTVSGPEWFW